MKIICIGLALLFFISASVFAQTDMILEGLLDIGLTCQSDPCPVTPLINIYDRPDEKAKIIGTIDILDNKSWPDNDEFAYETPAVDVFDTKENWYEVRLHGQTGWIKSAKAYTYLPYPELLKDKMSFISVPDVAVRQSPSESSKILKVLQKKNDELQISVDVLDIRRDAGKTPWIKINIMSDSICSPGYDVPSPRVLATGWIKAYENNKPTVWFYSRGC